MWWLKYVLVDDMSLVDGVTLPGTWHPFWSCKTWHAFLAFKCVPVSCL